MRAPASGMQYGTRMPGNSRVADGQGSSRTQSAQNRRASLPHSMFRLKVTVICGRRTQPGSYTPLMNAAWVPQACQWTPLLATSL